MANPITKVSEGDWSRLHETKDLLSKEIRFGTTICPRSKIGRISEVFPSFVRVNKQFEYLDFFRTGPSPIAMIRSTSFSITLFRKPKTRSYGYVKYRISNPSRKRRETDTQLKVKLSKQNSILDLIDTYRILWKAVFDESRMYGLEGDFSYLLKSTRVKKPK
ncbi:hypothetical protein IEQ34_025750 [Dendrobium chrysotoxum]|uniref:Ribosomal protein S10 n=1 Tax=Dendrobium chrysotoxum TaxID=161865 RepID=A0AAV7FNI7_DENCH|nr:hypothetical protein IEQ34_025750 [Dendrobium chrysotoxum]